MIKQIAENLYKIKVGNVSYIIEITVNGLAYDPYYYRYTIINKSNMACVWRALGIKYFLTKCLRDCGIEPFLLTWDYSIRFTSESSAKKFLFYVDRKYNPTPQKIGEFVDLDLWINF